MLVFMVLWVVVIFAATRWLAARSSRLQAGGRVEASPEIPGGAGPEIEIPDTVPTEWVRTYRDE